MAAETSGGERFIQGLCTGGMIAFLLTALFMAGPIERDRDELKAEAARRGHAEFFLPEGKSYPVWRWKELPSEKAKP